MELEFKLPYGKIAERKMSDIRNEIIKLWFHKSDMTKAVVSFNEYQHIGSGKNIYCEIMLNFHSEKHFIHTIGDSFEKCAMEAVRELREMSYQQELLQNEAFKKEANILVV